MFNFLCHGNFFDQEKKNTLATGLIPPNPLSLQRFNDSVLLVKHNPYSNPVYTRRGHLPFDLVKYNQIVTKTLLSGAARKKKKIQDVISVRLPEGVLKVHSMQFGGSPVNQIMAVSGMPSSVKKSSDGPYDLLFFWAQFSVLVLVL